MRFFRTNKILISTPFHSLVGLECLYTRNPCASTEVSGNGFRFLFRRWKFGVPGGKNVRVADVAVVI